MSVSSFPQGTIAASAVGIVYNLDGHAISDADSPGPVSCGVRINSDGTVDQYRSTFASYSQIDSATDWVIPNSVAPNGCYVRATLIGQTGAASRTGTLGSWLAISGSPEWKIQKNTTGSADWNLTIEIATDSGGTDIVASGTYSLDVEVF